MAPAQKDQLPIVWRVLLANTKAMQETPRARLALPTVGRRRGARRSLRASVMRGTRGLWGVNVQHALLARYGAKSISVQIATHRGKYHRADDPYCEHSAVLSQAAEIRFASLLQILTCSSVGLQYKDWWGNEACADCLAGFFSPTAGAKTCQGCAPGAYSAVAGAAHCIACPANSNSRNESTTATACECNAGYTGIYQDPTSKLCKDPVIHVCSGQDVSSMGVVSDACYTLAAKYAQGVPACANIASKELVTPECKAAVGLPCGAACSACVAGTYKYTKGSGGCMDCPPGMYSTVHGADRSSWCVKCPANSHSPAASSTSSLCTCNAGYEKDYFKDGCKPILSYPESNLLGLKSFFSAYANGMSVTDWQKVIDSPDPLTEERMFYILDGNSDDRLTFDEYRKCLNLSSWQIDFECSSFEDKMMLLWFYGSLDAPNVDLSITKDEVMGALTQSRIDKGIAMDQATQFMSIMDANRNGKVSLTEFDRGAKMKYLDSYGPTKFYSVSLDRTDFFQQNYLSYTKAFMKIDQDGNNLLTMQECLNAGFDFMTCYYYAPGATNSTKSCQDMRGFVDSEGQGCDAWAKNPTWCEGSPEDGKFDPPSEYANEDGIDPGMACCVCRRRQFCEDKPGFVDNQGEGCDVWTKNPTWCVGSPEDGVFDPPSDYANGEGLDPSMACCVCRKALGRHISDQGVSGIAFDELAQGNQHNPVVRMLTTLAEGCQPCSCRPGSLEWDIRSGRRVPGPLGHGSGSECKCDFFTQDSCRSHGCTWVGWEHGKGCNSKVCEDMPGFFDSEGQGCDVWAENPTWCEGSPEDGKFDPPADYANDDGIDPSMACCVCRRGQFCEALEAPVIHVDRCQENFMHNKEKGDDSVESCSDPLLGGLVGCCYDVMLGDCKTCYRDGDCTKAPLYCAQKYLDECGTNASNKSVASESFQARAGSCAVSPKDHTAAYWNHPGYVLSGRYKTTTARSGIQSEYGCAEICGDLNACGDLDDCIPCNSFIYISSERLCMFLVGTVEDVCVAGSPGCVYTIQGLDGAITERTPNGGPLWMFDTGGLYCAPNAMECGCTREYFQCLLQNGCEGEDNQVSSFADMCSARGCSSDQCGLRWPKSSAFASACTNQFFDCLVVKDGDCVCTRTFVDCMSTDQDAVALDMRTGLTLIDMCTLEGCTSDDCGLGQEYCNATSLTCATEHMACSGGAYEYIGWDPLKTGLDNIGVPPVLDRTRVTFPLFSGNGLSCILRCVMRVHASFCLIGVLVRAQMDCQVVLLWCKVSRKASSISRQSSQAHVL